MTMAEIEIASEGKSKERAFAIILRPVSIIDALAAVPVAITLRLLLVRPSGGPGCESVSLCEQTHTVTLPKHSSIRVNEREKSVGCLRAN